MFSADYPYGPMHRATDFFEQLPISPMDKEKIAHLNAETSLWAVKPGERAVNLAVDL